MAQLHQICCDERDRTNRMLKGKLQRQKGCRALLSVNKLILSDTNSFVDKERQQAAQLHQLRCDERDRTNRMLKEKLRDKKDVERYLVSTS